MRDKWQVNERRSSLVEESGLGGGAVRGAEHDLAGVVSQVSGRWRSAAGAGGWSPTAARTERWGAGAAGYSVFYGYDVRGLQLYARFSSDSGQGITNTYDGFGRLRLSSSNMGVVTRNVAWDYEPNVNRRWITHPDGALFEYAYDDADRLLHLSENGPAMRRARPRNTTTTPSRALSC